MNGTLLYLVCLCCVIDDGSVLLQVPSQRLSQSQWRESLPSLAKLSAQLIVRLALIIQQSLRLKFNQSGYEFMCFIKSIFNPIKVLSSKPQLFHLTAFNVYLKYFHNIFYSKWLWPKNFTILLTRECSSFPSWKRWLCTGCS